MYVVCKRGTCISQGREGDTPSSSFSKLGPWHFWADAPRGSPVGVMSCVPPFSICLNVPGSSFRERAQRTTAKQSGKTVIDLAAKPVLCRRQTNAKNMFFLSCLGWRVKKARGCFFSPPACLSHVSLSLPCSDLILNGECFVGGERVPSVFQIWRFRLCGYMYCEKQQQQQLTTYRTWVCHLNSCVRCCVYVSIPTRSRKKL